MEDGIVRFNQETAGLLYQSATSAAMAERARKPKPQDFAQMTVGEMTKEQREEALTELIREVGMPPTEKLNELADQVTELRADLARLEELKAASESDLAEAEKLLITVLQESGIKSFNYNGSLYGYMDKVYVRVLAADRDRQIEWLESNGLGDLVKPTVNSQTFSATIRKEFIDEGKALPDFVKTETIPTLFVRGGASKGGRK